MKVVNLFGGPGSGKSTAASELFVMLKKMHYKVELVTEFAKELTYEKRHDTLKDQLYVVARQNHRMQRLTDQVDWIIVDSPIIMNIVYCSDDYLPNYYRKLVNELFMTYENYNFYINRGDTYQTYGRNQTLDEALIKDKQILGILNEFDIQYTEVPLNNASLNIFSKLIKE